jgi:hypothetical protein
MILDVAALHQLARSRSAVCLVILATYSFKQIHRVIPRFQMDVDLFAGKRT